MIEPTDTSKRLKFFCRVVDMAAVDVFLAAFYHTVTFVYVLFFSNGPHGRQR
jgi:hypothetical protein